MNNPSPNHAIPQVIQWSVPDQSAPKDVEAVVISPPAQVCGQWTFDSSWQYPISTVCWVRCFRTYVFLNGMAMPIYQWNFNYVDASTWPWWNMVKPPGTDSLQHKNFVKIQHPNASNFQDFSRRILQLWIGWPTFILVRFLFAKGFFHI